MSYIKAEDCLPPELIKQIQNYIQGSQIYIPGTNERKYSWGERNGTRSKLKKRNLEIRSLRNEGWSVPALADRYHLSVDSIRKIIYSG